MKRPNAFLEVIVRRLAGAGRHHVSRLPEYPTLPPALNPDQPVRFPSKRFYRRKFKISARVHNALSQAATLILILGSLPLFAAVREVSSIGLTVGNLNRELRFYTNTLPFQLVSISDVSGNEKDALLGLHNAKLRVATLKLGDETLVLTEHLADKGRQIPIDSRSFDHWFQHIAIVVSDMDSAYSRLRAYRVKHVSTAPQTLPEWNKNAGGIKAFYFQDPENHVLEIIWFPKGKGDPKWQSDRNKLFLGIDHTAIVVSDTDSSLAFYRDTLGMHVVGESENYGVEQEHLNQVFGAHLRITALRSPHGPGIEFLEYITPPGGRPLAANASPRDVLFWNTRLVVDRLSTAKESLTAAGGHLISTAESLHTQIVRDPDGHALQLEEFSPQTAAAVRP